MTTDKALTDSMDLVVATDLLGKYAIEIAKLERASDVAREILDEVLAEAKAKEEMRAMGFSYDDPTPPTAEGDGLGLLERNSLLRSQVKTLTKKCESLADELATAKESAPPPVGEAGYYCNECNQKMRVQSPLQCFCDNKECSVNYSKNPPLLVSPSVESQYRDDLNKIGDIVNGDSLTSYDALPGKVQDIVDHANELEAEIERQQARLAEAQATWAAQDLYVKRIENEKDDLRARVKVLETMDVISGNVAKKHYRVATGLRSQLAKSEERGNRNSKIIEAVCEQVLDVVDGVPGSPQALVKRKLDALSAEIATAERERDEANKQLADVGELVYNGCSVKYIYAKLESAERERDEAIAESAIDQRNAAVSQQESSRLLDCVAAAHDDTAMLIEAINKHYGIWVANECFTEGEVQELLEVSVSAIYEPGKCPRCNKPMRRNTNGIYKCPDGQLCGEAISVDAKSATTENSNSPDAVATIVTGRGGELNRVPYFPDFDQIEKIQDKNAFPTSRLELAISNRSTFSDQYMDLIRVEIRRRLPEATGEASDQISCWPSKPVRIEALRAIAQYFHTKDSGVWEGHILNTIAELESRRDDHTPDDGEGIDGPPCIECGEQTKKPQNPAAGYADWWWCPSCNDFVDTPDDHIPDAGKKVLANEELESILKKHRLRLNGEGGKRADFFNADLRCANFANADLAGCNFRDANLTGVSLRCAHFTNAVFDNADLTNANLTGADLTGVSLRCADLTNAVFDEDTNLTGCDLRGAKFDRESLSVAITTDTKFGD